VSPNDLEMVPKPCVIQQYHNHYGVFYKVYVIDEDVMVYRRPSLPDLPPLNSDNKNIRSLSFDSRYCYPKLENFVRDDEHTVTDSCSKNDEDSKRWNSGAAPVLHQKKKVKSTLHEATPTIQEQDSGPVPLLTAEVTKEEEIYGNSVLNRLLSPLIVSVIELFTRTANELRKTFGLTLFGFDVIFPADDVVAEDDDSVSHEKKTTAEAASVSHSRNLMVIDVNYFPSYKEVKDFPDRLRNYLRKLSFEAVDVN
jgi:hypothetical protein